MTYAPATNHLVHDSPPAGSAPRPWVTRLGAPNRNAPSGVFSRVAVQRSNLPPWPDKKASILPSGDQAGERESPSLLTRSGTPSGWGTAQTSLLPPSQAAKARASPEGDHWGSQAPPATSV